MCVVSIVRVVYINDVSLADPAWDDVNAGMLSVIEACVGVVSACLPTLRPLFKHVFDRKAMPRMPMKRPLSSSNPRSSSQRIRLASMSESPSPTERSERESRRANDEPEVDKSDTDVESADPSLPSRENY